MQNTETANNSVIPTRNKYARTKIEIRINNGAIHVLS